MSIINDIINNQVMGGGIIGGVSVMGGPAPFVPTDISGNILWLRGDIGITQTSGNISAWTDQSGNGNDATQATSLNQPTYTTNINSQKTLTFDGANSFMNLPSFAILGAKTIVTVVRLAATPSVFASVLTLKDTAGTLSEQTLFASSAGYQLVSYVVDMTAFGETSVGYFPISPEIDSNPHSYLVTYNGITVAPGNFTAQFDSTDEAVVNSGAFARAPSDSASIGARVGVGGNTFYFQGDIAEIIVYNNVISSGDQIKLNTYLESRYNLAWTPASLGSKLIDYWEALPAQITLDGSSNVQDWTGSGPSHTVASQATAANRPGFVASGGGGDNGYLVNAANTQLIATLSTDQPIYIAMIINSSVGTSGSNAYLFDSGANANIIFQNTSPSELQTYAGNLSTPISFTANTDTLVEAFFNSSSSSIAINGGTPVVSDVGVGIPSTAISIGNYGGGGDGFDGRIAVVILCNAALTSDERTSLLSWAVNNWGVP